MEKTGERIIPSEIRSKEEYLIYIRDLFAYDYAKELIPENSNVLELGTGEGYGPKRLSDSKKVKKYIGLDVDESSIKKAKEKYFDEKLSFEVYDGYKIPYEDKFFNMVVSFQVIEHVEDDMEFVKEIYRVLKEGGVFVVTTPNREIRLKPGQKPWNRFHLREYNSDDLREVLLSSFKNVQILGVKGNEEIQSIEKNRMKKYQKFVSIDPLNLRRLIPESLKPKITQLYSKFTFEKKDDEDYVSQYKIDDHYMTEKGLNESLDLVGVARKEGGKF